MGKKSKNLNLNKIILRWEIKIQIIILTQDEVMNENLSPSSNFIKELYIALHPTTTNKNSNYCMYDLINIWLYSDISCKNLYKKQNNFNVNLDASIDII